MLPQHTYDDQQNIVYVFDTNEALDVPLIIKQINETHPCEQAFEPKKNIARNTAIIAVVLGLAISILILLKTPDKHLTGVMIVLTLLITVFTELTYWFDNSRFSNSKCLLAKCRTNSFLMGTFMSFLNIVGLFVYSEQLWNLTGKKKFLSNKYIVSGVYLVFLIVYKYLFSIHFTKNKERVVYDGDRTFTLRTNEDSIGFPYFGTRSFRNVIFALLQIFDILLPLISLYELGNKTGKNLLSKILNGFKKTITDIGTSKEKVKATFNALLVGLSVFIIPYLDYMATYSVYAVHPQNDLNNVCKDK